MFENACDESVTIRIQRPEDDEGIVELLLAAFGRWPRLDSGVPTNEYLRWKRECDPEGLKYNCVAEVEGQIVGAQFYWIQNVKAGDAVVRSAQGHDFCVHPDFQGLGIRTGMKKLAYETVELETEFSLSVDSDHPAMAHMVDKAGIAQYDLANKVYDLQCEVAGRSGTRSEGNVRTRRVDHFDERTTEMCADAATQFQLMVLRTQESLNWRYADRRAGSYAIYVAEERDDMLGYAVGRSAGDQGYIADLLVRPGRSDALSALLRETLAGFVRDSVLSVRVWSFAHHPYQSVLSEAGFATKRRSWVLRARARGTTPDPVSFRDDPKAVMHATAGDFDQA